MELAIIKSFLLWATLLNFAVLTFWFLMLAFAHNWVYRMHSKWFKMSEEQFSVVHYSGMLILKMAIFFFYLLPYIAICIIE